MFNGAEAMPPAATVPTENVSPISRCLLLWKGWRSSYTNTPLRPHHKLGVRGFVVCGLIACRLRLSQRW